MAAATQDNGDVEKTEPVGAQEAALVASPETQTEPPIKAVSKDHVGAKAWLDMFGVTAVLVSLLETAANLCS